MGKSRRLKWDNIKAILIFCVVLGHIAYFTGESNYNGIRIQLWIYSFHMPAFIFISGHLAKRSIDNKRWDKVFSLFFLYLFLKAVIFLSDVYLNGIKDLAFSLFNENDIPWFALSLFWYHIFAILTKRIDSTFVLAWSVFLAVIIGYSDNASFLAIQRTLTFLPFFYCGYYIDDKIIADYSTQAAKLVSVLALMLSVVAVFYLYAKTQGTALLLFRGRYSYPSIAESGYIYGWIWRLCSTGFALLVIMAMIVLIPDKQLGITRIGAHTLSVYAFHQVLLDQLYKIGFYSDWVLGNHAFIKCVLTVSLIVFILGWFEQPDAFIRKLIRLPVNNINK